MFHYKYYQYQYHILRKLSLLAKKQENHLHLRHYAILYIVYSDSDLVRASFYVCKTDLSAGFLSPFLA